MNRRNTLTATAASLLLLSLALPAGNAVAQCSAIAGTWTLVSADNVDGSGKKTPVFGANPRGSLIFVANGRYNLWVGAASLPKIASNNRVKASDEENRAIVAGNVSHFGKYTMDDKSFTFHVETSSFPNWDGTTQKRACALSGDQLTYTNPVGTGSGARIDLVWRRAK
jgi:hypothetical protein